MVTFSLFFLLLVSFGCSTGGAASEAERKGGDGVGVVAGGALWCVAKNNAEDAALQAALDWACGPGGADCAPIQSGGPCYQPDDVQSHASFAFNDYFLRHGSASTACDFAGSSALTSLDPSHESCRFPSSSSAGNGSFTGSATGSGLGPAGADTSGCTILPLKAWPWTVALAVLMVLFPDFR